MIHEEKAVTPSSLPTYADVLARAPEAPFTVEGLLPEGRRFDFGLPFLPEGLARTRDLTTLSARERLALNHVRAHGYLALFGLVEAFILPFVEGRAVADVPGAEAARKPALDRFAHEEAKHMALFERFRETFARGFGHVCDVVGPPDAVASAVLARDPLGVALTILHIEWMTQRHYVESVRTDGSLEPAFATLLEQHFVEEAQHAYLDALVVHELAAERDASGIARGVDAYLEIVGMVDGLLDAQREMDLESLSRAIGRTLGGDERAEIAAAQQRALRFTFLGSGMTHPRFVATLEAIAPHEAARVAARARDFV